MACVHQIHRSVAVAACLCLLGSLVLPSVSQAKSAAEIDASVDAALARFAKQVKGSEQFLHNAKAVLVFPSVIQAGIGVGGQYGEGAMRIRGKTTAYYSITSASVGFQLGAQTKDIIIALLDSEALRNFQNKEGWQVGVDGSVVLVNVGAAADINSMKLNQPIVGFVVGQKGLMYNLTLQGSKITKLHK
ncbi:MAG TPA: YSC84-related protein [bacterium]|nr:YSC84-related protein [bacterium]